MEEKNDNVFDWTEAYNVIRKCFCNKCSMICIEQQKLICFERFLLLAERWEIAFYERCEKIIK
jgi:hypothetical protein